MWVRWFCILQMYWILDSANKQLFGCGKWELKNSAVPTASQDICDTQGIVATNVISHNASSWRVDCYVGDQLHHVG